MRRSLLVRLGWLSVLALLAAGCQRTLIYVKTPQGGNPLGPSQTPERSASMTLVDGVVETRTSSSAAWTSAAKGQVLNQGSELRTGKDGQATIQLTEGSTIHLGPSTALTFSLLNPFLENQLTEVKLGRGQVWVLLNGGALDVVTPLGTATVRAAYLSVDYEPQGRTLEVTCLQGVCGYGSVLIPSGYKLLHAETNTSPEPMTLADYGVWGITVPETTQFAPLATEAIAQGSATLPVVAPATATPTLQATNTARPTNTPPATRTPPPTSTPSAVPSQPTTTPAPTHTPRPTPTPLPPTNTPLPSPTQPVFLPTVTPRPFTPLPPAPIIGRHVVQPGETVFCIGRGYGVLPAAIIQANGLSSTGSVFPGQVLSIPEVQWVNILSGPVCAPQFSSPFPGLPVPTATSAATPVPPGPPLMLAFDYYCTSNCGSSDGSYTVHFVLQASGGTQPYVYNPAQAFDLTLPHCGDQSGTISVTSADGQSVSKTWVYHDPSCPNP